MYDDYMDNELEERAQLFSRYVCAELKGAIVTRGLNQADVATAIGRQKANLSRWLNAKPPIAIDVAQEVCEYIGVNLGDIVERANRRLVAELGPYIAGDAELADRIAANPNLYDIAANKDKNKKLESETPRD